jgi:hypothetical protein
MNSGRTEFGLDIFPRRRDGGAENAQKKIVFGYGCGLKGRANSNGLRTQGDRHRGPFRGSDPNVNNSRRNVL